VGGGDGAWEHGVVSFESPPQKELATLLLNCSSLIDVMSAAYSMPDDYECEMQRLKGEDGEGGDRAAEVLNDAVSTALYAAAFEEPLPEVRVREEGGHTHMLCEKEARLYFEALNDSVFVVVVEYDSGIRDYPFSSLLFRSMPTC